MKKLFLSIMLVFSMFLSSFSQSTYTVKEDSIQRLKIEFDNITVKQPQAELSKAFENNAKALLYVGDALNVNAENNIIVANALIEFSKSKLDRLKIEYNIDKEVWKGMIQREILIRSFITILSILIISFIATWMYKYRHSEVHWRNILIRGSTAIVLVIILYVLCTPLASSLFNSDYNYYKELLTTF